MIVFNLWFMYTAVHFGIIDATCTIIGNFIGLNEVSIAEFHFGIISFASICINITSSSLLYRNRDQITKIFADEGTELYSLVIEIIPLLALMWLFNFAPSYGVVFACGL